jgi:hypothetical protein
MTKKIRITTVAVGASLAGTLLLGATPAAAGDASEDAKALHAEMEQSQPRAPASAVASVPAEHDQALLAGSGSGETIRGDARHDSRAKQDRDKNDSDEYEFEQEVWTGP